MDAKFTFVSIDSIEEKGNYIFEAASIGFYDEIIIASLAENYPVPDINAICNFIETKSAIRTKHLFEYADPAFPSNLLAKIDQLYSQLLG